MKDLLIPFGYSNKTGAIIEPSEAGRGRGCDAYCPGCETPLISRHPRDANTRIHFAHDSRHPKASKEVIKNCPFNGHLAIMLMARSLATKLLDHKLSIPKLKIRVSCRLCQSTIFTDCVSKKNSITMKKAESPYMLLGVKFDIRIDLGNASILIWLAYADRPLPDIDFKELDRVGVLKIDVNSFEFSPFQKGTMTFQEAVKEFLLTNGKREWVHHPSGNSRAIKKAKQEKHCCVLFQCDRCNSKWFHNVKKLPKCPKNCPIHYTKKSPTQPSFNDQDKTLITN